MAATGRDAMPSEAAVTAVTATAAVAAAESQSQTRGQGPRAEPGPEVDVLNFFMSTHDDTNHILFYLSRSVYDLVISWRRVFS